MANFNERGGLTQPLDPSRGDGWSGERILRADFLATVLLHPAYQCATPYQGVRIVGAWFREPVILSAGVVHTALVLHRCRFDDTLDLSFGRSITDISLAASAVRGVLALSGIRIGGNLILDNRGYFAHVDLHLANIRGALMLGRGSRFGKIDLHTARVGVVVDLSAAKATGTVDMNRLWTRGSVYLRNGASFKTVVLRAARIGGKCELIDANVRGELDMNTLTVDDSILMRRGRFRTVDLRNARAGMVDMDHAKLGSVNMDSIRVEGSLQANHLRAVRVVLRHGNIGSQLALTQGSISQEAVLESLAVGGELLLSSGRLGRRVVAPYIRARVLDMSGSRLGIVDLTDARISEEFRLDGCAPCRRTSWNDVGTLILRRAEIGSFQDRKDAWPANLDLEGLVYSSLVGPLRDGASDLIADRDVAWLIGWLERQARFSPQPYEQLASTLRVHGYREKASEILMAARDRERRTSRWGGTWLSLWFLRVLAGYGYRPSYIVGWLVAFWVFGSVVFCRYGGGLRGRSAMMYSLHRLFPVMRLFPERYEVTLPPRCRFRFYFGFHTVMGYVLVTLLVAWASGLLQ